jgi:formylglycine-generating enzyme required for sulfatase activity
MMHPDRFSQTKQRAEWELANEMLKELNVAYNILSDTATKKSYDSTIQDYFSRDKAKDIHGTPEPARGTHSDYKKTQHQDQSVKKKNKAIPLINYIISLFGFAALISTIFSALLESKKEQRFISLKESSVIEVLYDEIARPFVMVPTGEFQMGSRADFNSPERLVVVDTFFIGVSEITYADWHSVLSWAKSNGYLFFEAGKGAAYNKPVTSVNWYDALKWCNAKSEKQGLAPCYKVAGAVYRMGTSDEVSCEWSASGYRLPTEVEWEKAARGGLVGRSYPNGDSLSEIDANFGALGPVRVKSYPANGYGLHDMAGNVWEWCWDWYERPDHSPEHRESSRNLGIRRVLRGGCWRSPVEDCRVSCRNGLGPDLSSDTIGFRLVRGSNL